MRVEPSDVVTELEGLLSSSSSTEGQLWLEVRSE